MRNRQMNQEKPQLTERSLRYYLNRYAPYPVDEAAVLNEVNSTYASYRTWEEVPFTLDAGWLHGIIDRYRF